MTSDSEDTIQEGAKTCPAHLHQLLLPSGLLSLSWGMRTDFAEEATYWVYKKDWERQFLWLTVEILKF